MDDSTMFCPSQLVKNLGFKKKVNVFEMGLEALLFLSCPI